MWEKEKKKDEATREEVETEMEKKITRLDAYKAPVIRLDENVSGSLDIEEDIDIDIRYRYRYRDAWLRGILYGTSRPSFVAGGLFSSLNLR